MMCVVDATLYSFIQYRAKQKIIEYFYAEHTIRNELLRNFVLSNKKYIPNYDNSSNGHTIKMPLH